MIAFAAEQTHACLQGIIYKAGMFKVGMIYQILFVWFNIESIEERVELGIQQNSEADLDQFAQTRDTQLEFCG